MNMKRSHEPVAWLLFAAGGMVAALIWPSLLLLLTAALIFSSESFGYVEVLSLSSSGFGRLVWLALIIFPLWHALHRLFHLTRDIQFGSVFLMRSLAYGAAFVLSVSVVTLVIAL
jgi:fumarate reductase subunit D